jgi:HlyD family secretion protein
LLSIVDVANPYAVFNIREDMMPHFRMGSTMRGDVPAIVANGIWWEVFYVAPLGSYATWQTTHLAEGYDMRTFEIRLRPEHRVEGLRPGMTAIIELKDKGKM